MKKFVCGLLTGTILMTTIPALAESTQSINAIFGRVKVVVNDKPVEQETLLYNGTTYVPLRAVSEILDKEVQFDDSTKTAYIDEKGTNREIAPIFEGQDYTDSAFYVYDFDLIDETLIVIQEILDNQNLGATYSANKNMPLANKYLILALDSTEQLEKVNFTSISKEMDTALHNFTTSEKNSLNCYIKAIEFYEQGKPSEALKQLENVQKYHAQAYKYLNEYVQIAEIYLQDN